MALAVLNGAIGDYLARTENPLATGMHLVVDGRPLVPGARALERAFPGATPVVVVFVHGLMCTETVWEREDGTSLATDLAARRAATSVFVRYNSGVPIAESGAALSRLVGEIVAAWPVPVAEVALVGFSMGGLVVRSAFAHSARHEAPWLARVKRAFYIGSPHLGAPAERLGRGLVGLLRAIPDPYTELAADLGDLRSDGVKDLGDGDLRAEGSAHPIPLPSSIEHFLFAGTLTEAIPFAQHLGDALVPVPSATFGAWAPGQVAPPHVRVFPGEGHLALPRSLAVSAAILEQWKEGR